MPSIQGEFANKAAAQAAMSRLAQAGIPAAHRRLWNIIPTVENDRSCEGGAARGAVLGGALAGASGILVGAALGAEWDNDAGSGHHLPEPSGVRLVVDIGLDPGVDADPGGPDVAALLREAGATNIRRTAR